MSARPEEMQDDIREYMRAVGGRARTAARAMGRASPLRKRTSHVTVIVDRKE